MRVDHLDELPRGSAAHPSGKVDLDPRPIGLGEREAEHAAPRRGGGLDADLVIVERHGVVAGLGDLGLVAEARAVAVFRPLRAALGVQRPGGGHHQEVAQVAIPAHAAHVRETEAFDRCMPVGIARSVIAAGDGVRAELHQSEGRGRRREMSCRRCRRPFRRRSWG